MRALRRWTLAALMIATGGAGAASDPSTVWPVYRQANAQQPLVYERGQVEAFEGGQRRSFMLQSQYWPNAQQGAMWRHRVQLLQPDVPQSGPALLVINNGVAYEGSGRATGAADDFPDDVLETMVRTLGMAIVSIADVPPQAMALPEDPSVRAEDDLVAASWRRYLDDPVDHAHWPLHVPMAEAAVRAMDLADRELPVAQRPSYVVTGASKRAWVSWLLPLVDERVSHIAPFVIDMNWQALAPHIGQAYGGRWPIALHPYVRHGITDAIGSEGFNDLMHIVDPYTYLQGPHAARLALPKLLVNASGDDFFPPDGTEHYLSALPGLTTLRVAPNSDHGGIRRFSTDSLVPALRRWRTGRTLPQVRAQWRPADALLRVHTGSERPRRATLWQAHNAEARDFRHACGIVYKAHAVELNDGAVPDVPLPAPASGWTASFVELHYDDGMIATTPVQVLPRDRFPGKPPVEAGGRCKLVPVSVSAPSAVVRASVD